MEEANERNEYQIFVEQKDFPSQKSSSLQLSFPFQQNFSQSIPSAIGNKCCFACCFTLQFYGMILEPIIWGAIAFYFITFLGYKNNIIWSFLLCPYLIYVFFKIIPRIYQRINEIKDISKIKERIEAMLSAKPEILVSVCCYHYETKSIQKKDSYGNITTETIKVRVDTYKETKKFEYYSSRDISGLISFKMNQSSILGIFKEKVYFEDSVTLSDYVVMKNELYEKNKSRDEYITLYENVNTPRVNPINIPPERGLTFFEIFSILFMFHNIYSCIKNKQPPNPQKIEIRKIISSRYNLISPSFKKYLSLIPSLELYKNRYTYPLEQIGYCNQSINPKEPTEEEIAYAKKYSELVPSYQLSDDGYAINFQIPEGTHQVNQVFSLPLKIKIDNLPVRTL